jgi:hypothetical protein
MRQLKAKDIGPFTKILTKMELKDAIKGIFTKSAKGEKGEIVSDLIWAVIENYSKAEKEFFSFLADLEGKGVEEIKELSIDEFIEILKTLFSSENLPFFKSAAK